MWCEADPNQTDRAAELWRDAARDLRQAAVDVTTCIRLAEAAWDSSHAHPQYVASARAERQLLWDLADRADRTAELLEDIRDEQRASKDAERDYYEQIAWDVVFTVVSVCITGLFGMAARVGRAALFAAAGTSALGRLATIVTNLATKVRALPVYLRAPVTGLAWGTGGAANYVASDSMATAVVRRRADVPAAEDVGLAFLLSAVGGAALSEVLRRTKSVPTVGPGSNGAPSPWTMNWSKRGFAIEKMLGENLPPGFRTIDRFANNTATSIKSIDLAAPTYANQSTLTRRLTRYIDLMASYNGGTRAGVLPHQITTRELVIAIPPNATSQQISTLNAAIVYGQTRGVVVRTVIIP
jgi:hypothetical protein